MNFLFAILALLTCFAFTDIVANPTNRTVSGPFFTDSAITIQDLSMRILTPLGNVNASTQILSNLEIDQIVTLLNQYLPTLATEVGVSHSIFILQRMLTRVALVYWTKEAVNYDRVDIELRNALVWIATKELELTADIESVHNVKRMLAHYVSIDALLALKAKEFDDIGYKIAINELQAHIVIATNKWSSQVGLIAAKKDIEMVSGDDGESTDQDVSRSTSIRTLHTKSVEKKRLAISLYQFLVKACVFWRNDRVSLSDD